jgi:hypothetical protein
VDIVVDVAGVIEQYNLCIRDVGGVPWEFRHEDFNGLDMSREEKHVDWRKRVSLCLTPRDLIPYKYRRYYLSEWQIAILEGFLRNPFGKLHQKQISTQIWDEEFGGNRRMIAYSLTPYFTHERIVGVKKIDRLFKFWKIYNGKRF